MTVSDRGRSPSFVINENILGKWFRGSSSSNKFKNLTSDTNSSTATAAKHHSRNRVNLENYDQQQQVPATAATDTKNPPNRRNTPKQHLQNSDPPNSCLKTSLIDETPLYFFKYTYRNPQHRTAQRVTARRSVILPSFCPSLSYPPILCFTPKKKPKLIEPGKTFRLMFGIFPGIRGSFTGCRSVLP